MSLRLHEIAEANHRILNPFTGVKLMLLGNICRPSAETRQLDLACGKGEMLCRWSHTYGHSGIGVDLSPVFLAAAHQRAADLGVTDRLTFVQADAGSYEAEPAAFDIVSCIGATWIGGGIVGTLKLMQQALKADGLLLVGEPYWIEPPPFEAYKAMDVLEEAFTSLAGTLERIESLDLELVEMVLANQDSWDRYEASHWRTIDTWLRANPGDPDHAAMRDFMVNGRRSYLTYGRRYLGWGVFVLRPR